MSLEDKAAKIKRKDNDNVPVHHDQTSRSLVSHVSASVGRDRLPGRGRSHAWNDRARASQTFG